MFIQNILINFISEFHNIQLSMDDFTTQEKASKIKGIIFEASRKTMSIFKEEVRQIKNEIQVISLINGNDEKSKKLLESISLFDDICEEIDTYTSIYGNGQFTKEEISFLKNQVRTLIYTYLNFSMRVA
jgi:hypothetical protein